MLSLSVCLCVCLSVSALQVTVFVVGSWYLAWGILEWNPKSAIFGLWKSWDLTYLWLFLNFLGVFLLYILFKFWKSCSKKLFPFEIDFYHEGLFGEYLSILWFVNESFDFLTYLWLFLAFWSVFLHFIITYIRAVHCSSAGLFILSSICEYLQYIQSSIDA